MKPGNLSRQQSGSNASDYSDARGTPSPKALRAEPDGYVNMQPGSTTSGIAPPSSAMSTSSSSSHRIRTDSASSRRSDSNKTNSSDRLHHQNKGDYAEMAPLKSSGSIGSATGGNSSGEAYVSMDFRARHSFSSDTRPNMHHISSSQQCQQSPSSQGAYINMDMPGSGKGQGDQARSVSMENVESYVMYDPAHSKTSGSGSSSTGKPRTGSLGSKDKKAGGGSGMVPRPGGGRKPSSNSMSAVGGPSGVGQYGGHSASMSTRTGGSSDSLRSKSSSASRQSSMEKYGSLGKDFRKKSASMGSRPVSKSGGASGSKSLSFSSRGDGSNLHPREHYLQQHQQQQQQQQQLVVHASNLVPIRKTQREMQEETADEYVEFAPTVTLQDAEHQLHNQSTLTPGYPSSSSSGRGIHPASSGGSHSLSRSPVTVPSLPGSDENDSGYTMYNPALPPELVACSSSVSGSLGLARMAQSMASPTPHPLPQASYIQGQHHLPPSLPRQQHQPHQHHGHSQSPSSPSSSHMKSFASVVASHPPPKDNSEYVGYEPGVLPHPHHTEIPLSTSPSGAGVKIVRHMVEVKTDSEYVEYEPGDIPAAAKTASTPSIVTPALPHKADTSAYVGYDPSKTPPSISPSKPLSPGSAVSYIQGGSASKVSPAPGQPKPGSTIPLASPSSSVSPRSKAGGAQTSTSASVSSHSPTKPVVALAAPEDDSEYMGYNPAVRDTPASTAGAFGKPLSESKFDSSSDSCNMKENVMPTPTRAVSYIQGNSTGTSGTARGSVATPLKVDVGAGERNSRASSTPPLSINENPPASGGKTNKDIGSSQPKLKGEKQDKVRQQGLPSDQPGLPQHQLNVNFHRAMSSPSGTTAEFPSSASQGIGQLECPSPSNSGPTSFSRHKHSSGSSNSSQKSNRRVSSSNDSLRGDKKSDSNSSLNSSTSSLKGSGKRSGCGGGWVRDDGGERSLGGSLERSPLSPAMSSSSRNNSGEFFCGEVSPLTSQQLEAKIVPVESRIRHSLGDMTTVAGGAGSSAGGAKEVQGQQTQGLIRPGSTPCMHNLDSSPGGGAGPGDSVFGAPPGGLHFSAPSPGGGDGGDANSNTGGSRSRHSLTDLNSYQQQQGAVGGGQAPSDAANQSGQQPQPKPLNYVKLDLSAPQEVPSGGDSGARLKSRNSSDADEKQQPLSYAEIDFVKSQNLSKALAMGNGSGDEPSKS